MNKGFLLLTATLFIFAPQVALAHRSGCHTLHTCASDNESYTCGDLGYPCNGTTTLEQIDPATIFVPLATEKIFTDTFGRKPTDTESTYWKKRFRSDKNSIYKIRAAMAWHKNKNSSGPAVSAVSLPLPAKVDVVKDMNSLFASVYGRLPTASESKYWLSRTKDKSTAPAVVGALTFHKEKGILH
ncbi:MAG TPA: hypothetical protein VJI96_04835 [Candidatus Andersenbacteria bacterium]|nr:hypothetical protein [Candidatus Andersenbacteria bacterium]